MWTFSPGYKNVGACTRQRSEIQWWVLPSQTITLSLDQHANWWHHLPFTNRMESHWDLISSQSGTQPCDRLSRLCAISFVCSTNYVIYEYKTCETWIWILPIAVNMWIWIPSSIEHTLFSYLFFPKTIMRLLCICAHKFVLWSYYKYGGHLSHGAKYEATKPLLGLPVL